LRREEACVEVGNTDKSDGDLEKKIIDIGRGDGRCPGIKGDASFPQCLGSIEISTPERCEIRKDHPCHMRPEHEFQPYFLALMSKKPFEPDYHQDIIEEVAYECQQEKTEIQREKNV
jgi:hypothetical protein